MIENVRSGLQVELNSLHRHAVSFKFVGNTNSLEANCYLKLENQSNCVIDILKISWDLWFRGMHIKNGTFTEKISLSPGAGHSLSLREVLLETQSADILWVTEQKENKGYLEGILFCKEVSGEFLFQKKFTFLNLSPEVIGDLPVERKKSVNDFGLDDLTGLQPHDFLEKNLQSFIAQNIPRGPMSLAMIDVDDFKKINDAYGHRTGDEVLRKISAEVKNAVSNKGLVIRYGGDEIAVLLISCSVQEAKNLMEELRKKIELLDYSPINKTLRATVSIGIASITDNASSQIFLKYADDMLFVSKQSGKNIVRVNNRRMGHGQ